MKMRKNIAFTLAETLVVMGIIGVVAALTIPNVNSATNEKENVVRLKKVYSNLNNAIGSAEAEYGPVTKWFAKDSNSTAKTKRFAGRVLEYIKTTKDCSLTTTGCYAGSDTIGNNNTSYKVVMADGSALSFSYYDDTDSTGATSIYVFADIDGPRKGANKLNKDIFRFRIPLTDSYQVGMTKGAISYGTDYSYLSSCYPDNLNYSESCTGWVIEMGNMDYLKSNCSKVLDGVNNTSCK